MQYNDSDSEHLGSGVVLFKNAIELDWKNIFNLSCELVNHDLSLMYTETIDPETHLPAYLNKSGYLFGKDSIDAMPKRGSTIHQNKDEKIKKIFNFIEESKDKYLLKYFEKFPLAYNCVWWKVKGHIVSYGPNVYLGSHSDISAEYVYGVHQTTHELALRNVVTSLVYLNSSVEENDLDEYSYTDGHHYFNYLDIEIKPKAGDILMFPSNYMAAHEVKPVGKGTRISYLGWYSQGTPNPNVNEDVCDPIKDPSLAEVSTNLYMPTLRDDYRDYLKSKGYTEYSDQYKVTKLNTD